jgi:predicted transposase/invertase (TIGR01784 family)
MKPNKNQPQTNTKRNKKMYFQRIFNRYIDPFLDFGFKKLFGQECNKDLLLDFLNELLYAEQGRIVSISYLKSEQLGITRTSRNAFFDIYCENEKGEKFIVELQNTEQHFFKDRTVFYSTFPIIEQAPKKEDWHFELKAVYVIAILNFVFEEDKNNLQKYRYDVKLSDIETHKVFYDKLTFIYLEVPKFNKEVHELETRFEKWMYVLKNMSSLEKFPDELREYIFEKIFEQAEMAKFTDLEYMQYAENLKIFRDNYNCTYFAIQKGIKEGIEKATRKVTKKITAQVAKAERKKMVLSSHQAGITLDTISVITGLTVDEINAILDENKLN